MCSYRNCQSKRTRITVTFVTAGASPKRHYCCLLHTILGLLGALYDWGGPEQSTGAFAEQEQWRKEAIALVEDIAEAKADAILRTL